MPTTRSKSERHQQFMQAFAGPFRFLDLPFELRMFVYKAVFTHSVLHIRRHPYKRRHTKLKPVVDCSDFPQALINTCRQIRHESRVLLAQMTRLFVEEGLDNKIPNLIGPEFRQHLGHVSGFTQDIDSMGGIRPSSMPLEPGTTSGPSVPKPPGAFPPTVQGQIIPAPRTSRAKFYALYALSSKSSPSWPVGTIDDK